MSLSPSTQLREHDATRERAQKGKRAARANDDQDFARLMSEEWGRRFVWRLLSHLDPEVVFAANAMQQSRNTGLRDFARRELRDKIDRLCPELYPVMVTENR